MSQSITFETTLFTHQVSYKNTRGEEKSVTLEFCLNPIKLLELVASFQPRKSKSANPARRGQDEITDEQQIKFLRRLAVAAAGWASEDGESFEPFEEFEDQLAGQAFLTKLLTSDTLRQEFAEIVMLQPFRTFVNFAKAEETNSKKDVQLFETQLAQLENIFKAGAPNPEETVEDRRARLEAELAAMNSTDNS